MVFFSVGFVCLNSNLVIQDIEHLFEFVGRMLGAIQTSENSWHPHQLRWDGVECLFTWTRNNRKLSYMFFFLGVQLIRYDEG